MQHPSTCSKTPEKWLKNLTCTRLLAKSRWAVSLKLKYVGSTRDLCSKHIWHFLEIIKHGYFLFGRVQVIDDAAPNLHVCFLLISRKHLAKQAVARFIEVYEYFFLLIHSPSFIVKTVGWQTTLQTMKSPISLLGSSEYRSIAE